MENQNNLVKQDVLSDKAVKFGVEIYDRMLGYDIAQQNQLISNLCNSIVKQRKCHLERIGIERDEYAKFTDELMKMLTNIS